MLKKSILPLLLLSVLVACRPTSQQDTATIHTLTLSNLAGENSLQTVRKTLNQSLSPKAVDTVLAQVADYNQTVNSPSLLADFQKVQQPLYDVQELDGAWAEKKGDFIGLNCRLTSYLLLEDRITIPQEKGDDSLLFFDLEASQSGQILEQNQVQEFTRLFGRVQTIPDQDPAVHAQKMSDYLSPIDFSETVSLVSLVIHDNLDGDSLFIGHAGILVPDKEGYLFVEKLSFQEPYQFISFTTKKEVFDYVRTKYAHFAGEGTAPPFIMENATYIPGT